MKVAFTEQAAEQPLYYQIQPNEIEIVAISDNRRES